MAQTNRLTVTPLNPTIGAVVSGIDLADAHTDATIADVRAALLAHKVLFFEDQGLTAREQRDFAARFGELHIHPLYPGDNDVPEILLLDNHADNPTDNDHWHTDVTFLERPAMGGLLYARQLPPIGGDTLWSSMTAAYRALSPAMRTFLAGLSAVHDFAHAFPPSSVVSGNAGRERYEAARAQHPPVIHPVVRTHPESGRKSLFVNPGFTDRIDEVERRESDALLDYLYAHMTRQEFLVRYRWDEGDLGFWDNRSTMHHAVGDYGAAHRVIQRVTIQGDRPY